MDNLNILIGNNLNKIRKERGYSLDQVAQLSGVSKSMLSQIEKGNKTPTVTTLWKIATGLNVSVSLLMDNQRPQVQHVTCKNLMPISEHDGKYKAYPLLPFNTDTNFEVFQMQIDAKSKHEASAHTAGIKEYVFVSEGEVDITVNDTVYHVSANEGLVFPGDVHHSYANNTDGIMKSFVLILYPGR